MMNKKSVPLTRRAVKNSKAASALTSDEEEDDSELVRFKKTTFFTISSGSMINTFLAGDFIF